MKSSSSSSASTAARYMSVRTFLLRSDSCTYCVSIFADDPLSTCPSRFVNPNSTHSNYASKLSVADSQTRYLVSKYIVDNLTEFSKIKVAIAVRIICFEYTKQLALAK